MIWVRMLGLFLLAPVLSSGVIMVRMRIFLAFFIALVIAPGVVSYMQNAPLTQSTGMYVVLLLKEFLVGVTMGFFLSVIFAAFNLSAQFFSVQIGLSIAEIFDVATGEQNSLFGFFFGIVAVLIFISLDGLSILLGVLNESYEVLPVIDFFNLNNTEMIMDKLVKYFGFMFIVAIKLSLPIVVTSVVLIVALGVIGRAIPQANILLVGLPIQMSLGLLFLLFSLPYMVRFFSSIVEKSLSDLLFILSNFSARGLAT